MPSICCLEENTEETIQALKRLTEFAMQESRDYLAFKAGKRARKKNSYVDFSKITELSVPTALIVAAVFERVNAQTHTKQHTIDEHLWDPGIVEMLNAFGFKDVINLRATKKSGRISDRFKIIPFSSGERAIGAQPGELQKALAALLPDDEREKLEYAEPYAGIFEAILNSHTWAYPAGHAWEFPQLEKWWITGAVDLDASTVTVVAYDQGVSIPTMLPRWQHYGKIRALASRLAARVEGFGRLDDWRNDGVSLRLAMKIARTSTGLPQHGKGLNSMLEVAQRAPWGRLRVLSRNGEYVWTTGHKEVSRSHPHALRGTLIEWQLRLR